MRPDRFTQLLVTAAGTIPGVTANATPEETGKSLRPYLVSVEAGGKSFRWQVVAASAQGDKYAEDEKEPILGEQPAAPAIEGQPGTPEHLEGALVAALLEMDAGEIAAVDVYSRRKPEPPAVRYGATFVLHDGSKIFLNQA
jgi:hypothetical protein